jgi:hypothetical protein
VNCQFGCDGLQVRQSRECHSPLANSSFSTMARPSLRDEVSRSSESALAVSYSLVMVLGKGLPGSEIGGLRETRHCEGWYE